MLQSTEQSFKAQERLFPQLKLTSVNYYQAFYIYMYMTDKGGVIVDYYQLMTSTHENGAVVCITSNDKASDFSSGNPMFDLGMYSNNYYLNKFKCKGTFLCSAVSSAQAQSTFTLYFPDRPAQSDSISTSLGSIQPHATINARRLLVHISTTCL